MRSSRSWRILQHADPRARVVEELEHVAVGGPHLRMAAGGEAVVEARRPDPECSRSRIARFSGPRRAEVSGSSGAMLAFEVRMRPGGGPPALHRHDPLELYRVERGELTFYLADESGRVERTVARAGEVVAIPGREVERFIRAAAEAAPGDVLALAAAHGIEITRPLG
jgi:mannose-6-phosphate isomerase-like protein (cupin superfamily)